MGGLQNFENRLEQMISGVFARAFRSAVQPVEISAALQRELDNNAQILSRERRLVPNSFHVELSTTDLERLAPYDNALAKELTETLREHAESQSYVFPGPVKIAFDEADDLTTGRFRVRSAAEAKVTTNATNTMYGRAKVFLEVNGARNPINPPGLVVGRGTDADLRINDPGISRRHVEFRIRQATVERGGDPELSVHDLGSTNGMIVNGTKTREATLYGGSTVRIGNTTMTVVLVDEESAMSELTLFLIRFAYLAILWIFVLSAISVIRTDMFGARMPSGGATPPRSERRQKAPKAPAKRRGSPTHVAVVEGANAGDRADLAHAPILIGRGPDAAIRLDDDYVSTRHARIASAEDQWFVEDLGSTNGTYVGSARITQPTTLSLGTQVRIGKTILELRK